MANKKDLIDAQAFARKRLLTAFVSGAPGGKELEPASPWKALIAGVSLAVIVVLVGVGYGFINSALPSTWENNTLVLVEDTGARYLAVDATLYPVLNGTSARLMMPAGSFTVVTVGSDSLADIPIGPAIGILGAPDDLPTPDNLIPAGWTACPVIGGTAVNVPGLDSANPTTAGAVVVSDGVVHVVAGGFRYAVGTDEADAILRSVGLADATPVEVDSRWLNLFTAGAPLEPIEVPNAGEPVPGTDLIIGTVLSPQGTANRFLVTPQGELSSLSPFAYQMYLLGTGVILEGERPVSPGEIAALPTAATSAGGDDWPADVLAPVVPDSSLCAVLTHDATGEPSTVLAETSALAAQPGVTVATRHGALVEAGGSTELSRRALQIIDESGTAFAIPGATEDTLGRLGYTEDDVSTSTSAWMQFFAMGPELTVEAAGSTPQGVVIAQPSAEASATPQPDESGDVAPSPPAPATPSAAPTAVTDISLDSTLDPGGNEQCEPGVVVYSQEPPIALKSLQALPAWNYATGDGVVIAVVDSGIDVNNAHMTEAVVGGINLVGDGERADGMSDSYGHGTAVAGIIAAQLIPESDVVGLAPNARLLSVRVLRDNSDESREAGFGMSAGRIADGIEWAVDNGADIINVSLSTVDDFPEIRAAVDYAAANDVLVVASAGNRNTSDSTSDSPRYPAAYAAPLSVAATNNDGLVTDDSIHGPHVDIAAPGMAVTTAFAGGGDCTFAADVASTSYATAYVTAAAALVKQAHPTDTYEHIKYRLTVTATRDGIDTRDDLAGWGVVQPADAIMLQPGTGERGPLNPFTGSVGDPVAPASVTVTTQDNASPFDATRTFMVATGVVVAAALAALAILATHRRRSEDPPEPTEDPRPGLLDITRSDATKVLQ